VAAKQDRLLLPAEAVHLENGTSTVLRPSSAEKTPPASVPIETGLTNGKQVEIVAGLQEGDTVLVPEIRLPAESDVPAGSPLSPMGSSSKRPVRH
jgi:macrolide-specific efflux system membrane fusion protein